MKEFSWVILLIVEYIKSIICELSKLYNPYTFFFSKEEDYAGNSKESETKNIVPTQDLNVSTSIVPEEQTKNHQDKEVGESNQVS